MTFALALHSARTRDAAKNRLTKAVVPARWAANCSSADNVVVLRAVHTSARAARTMSGDVLLDNGEENPLPSTMWPDGIVAASVTARSAPNIAKLARVKRATMANTYLLMVEETRAGADFPFSGEKLSPVPTMYGARDLDHACKVIDQTYRLKVPAVPGAPIPLTIGAFSHLALNSRSCHVIVYQARCFATDGASIATSRSPFRWTEVHGAGVAFRATRNINAISTSPRSPAMFRRRCHAKARYSAST